MSSPADRQSTADEGLIELTDIITKGVVPAQSGGDSRNRDASGVDKGIENLLDGKIDLADIEELERSLQAQSPGGVDPLEFQDMPDLPPDLEAKPLSGSASNFDDLDSLLAQAAPVSPAAQSAPEFSETSPELSAPAGAPESEPKAAASVPEAEPKPSAVAEPMSKDPMPDINIDALLDGLSAPAGAAPASEPKKADAGETPENDLESLLNSLEMPSKPGKSEKAEGKGVADDLDALLDSMLPSAKGKGPETKPAPAASAVSAAPAVEDTLDPFDAALAAATGTAPKAAKPAAPAPADPFEAALASAAVKPEPAVAAKPPVDVDPFEAALAAAEPTPELAAGASPADPIDPFEAALEAAAPVKELVKKKLIKEDEPPADPFEAALAAAPAAPAPADSFEAALASAAAQADPFEAALASAEAKPEAASEPEAGLEPEVTPEPATALDPFEAALAESEAKPEPVADPAATAVAEPEPAPELSVSTEEIQALLEPSAALAAPAQAAAPSASEIASEPIAAVAPELAPEAVVAPEPASAAAPQDSASIVLAERIELLEARLAAFGIPETGEPDVAAFVQSPFGAALVAALAEEVRAAVRPDLEKEAAAAAAKVIREEIAGLLDSQE